MADFVDSHVLAPVALRERAGQCAQERAMLGAQALWLESLRRDSGSVQAWRGYAETLLAQGRNPEALVCLEQAIRVARSADDQRVEILELLSQLYLSVERLHDCDEALSSLHELGCGGAAIEVRRAKVALGLRRFDDARRAFASAVERGYVPESSLRFERSMLALRALDGPPDWASAWDDYEARFAVLGHDGLTCYPHAFPLWQGESLSTQNLLVHREQGYGDMIMFASTLPQLRRQVAQLIVSVPPALHRLFAHSFPGVHVASSRVVEGEALRVAQDWLAHVPPVHVQLPFCSLGARMRRTAAAFGTPRAYLSADAGSRARFARHLSAMDPDSHAPLTVGIAWGARAVAADGSRSAMGAHKSIPPEQLGVLADAGHVRWVSLMNRDGVHDAARIDRLRPLDFSWALRDFMDTAALIEQMDVVVAVDTAVAHLAAAMGKETWVLLRWQADWRWDHEDWPSCWYPEVRLLRQEREGDWSAPLSRVVQLLRQRRIGEGE